MAPEESAHVLVDIHVAIDRSRVCPVTPLASNALFVSQNSPFGTLAPGQTVAMEVTMQNLDGTTWPARGPNPQNPQDNMVWGIQRIDVPNDVVPGAELTFSFQITAPAVPGTYNLQWRLVEEQVTWFGDFTPNIPIVVQVPLRNMNVHVAPYPVPAGHPVSIVVTANDALTGSAVTDIQPFYC